MNLNIELTAAIRKTLIDKGWTPPPEEVCRILNAWEFKL